MTGEILTARIISSHVRELRCYLLRCYFLSELLLPQYTSGASAGVAASGYNRGEMVVGGEVAWISAYVSICAA